MTTAINASRLLAIDLEKTMLNLAFLFLLLALAAGFLGVSGVAAVATDIAWVLFVLGLVLAVIHAVIGRRRL